MKLRFNDKQFSSLLQLKKKAYNNRIYSEKVFLNYNNEEIVRDVIINIEKTKSKFLEALHFI